MKACLSIQDAESVSDEFFFETIIKAVMIKQKIEQQFN